MRTRRLFLSLSLAAAWEFYVSVPAVQAADAKVRLVLVVGKDCSLKEISTRDLKRLYSGHRVFGASGEALIPFSHSAMSPDRVAFDRAVLNMSPDEVARYWVDRKIRGQSAPPRSIDSPAVLQRVVSKLNGAIGYVRASDVRDEVRILLLDGKNPTDQGYGLGLGG